MKTYFWTGTILLIAAAAIASSVPSADSSAKQLAGMSRSVRVEEFAARFQALDQAVETDDSEGIGHIEQSMAALIRFDLDESAARVRDLASRIAINGQPLPEGDDSTTCSPDQRLARIRIEFAHSLTILNAKESVYRELKNAYDLKYRYRLLGDYLNLLRRELNMPRLQLASTTGVRDIRRDGVLAPKDAK